MPERTLLAVLPMMAVTPLAGRSGSGLQEVYAPIAGQVSEEG